MSLAVRTVLLPSGKTVTGRIKPDTTALIAVPSIAPNGSSIQTFAHYGRGRRGSQNITTHINEDCGKAEKWKLSKS